MARQKPIVIAPQLGKQALAMSLHPEIMIYGGAAGSGKSRVLLMKPLQYKDDPNFGGVIFRKTIKQLDGAGGLWGEGKKLYRPFSPTIREAKHEVEFPSGATIQMTYMDHENDAEDNHQGLQYSFVGFDELTHFSQTQFLYLIGRMRSAAEGNSFLVGTCNPDPDSWVLNWVEWYLHEDGTPNEEKCGKIRYVLIVNNEPVFADTPEELALSYPEACFSVDPHTGEEIPTPPKSFCFINGTIFDNPALIRANPTYLGNLKAQTEVNRKRLLEGNWYAREEGSSYFKRENLIYVDHVPIGARCCRAWDKASEEPSEKLVSPDFTASIKLYKDAQGYYYIVGDYPEEAFDKKTETYGRFRKRSGERNNIILQHAQHDGEDCPIVFPLDPGGAGKDTYQSNASYFMSQGFIVKQDPMPNNKSKIVRFEPFATAVQNGLVRIVASSFKTKKTLDAYLKELESFNGERSTATRKDDWADATASAYNFMNKEVVLPSFSLGDAMGSPTRAFELRTHLGLPPPIERPLLIPDRDF